MRARAFGYDAPPDGRVDRRGIAPFGAGTTQSDQTAGRAGVAAAAADRLRHHADGASPFGDDTAAEFGRDGNRSGITAFGPAGPQRRDAAGATGIAARAADRLGDHAKGADPLGQDGAAGDRQIDIAAVAARAAAAAKGDNTARRAGIASGAADGLDQNAVRGIAMGGDIATAGGVHVAAIAAPAAAVRCAEQAIGRAAVACTAAKRLDQEAVRAIAVRGDIETHIGSHITAAGRSTACAAAAGRGPAATTVATHTRAALNHHPVRAGSRRGDRPPAIDVDVDIAAAAASSPGFPAARKVQIGAAALAAIAANARHDDPRRIGGRGRNDIIADRHIVRRRGRADRPAAGPCTTGGRRNKDCAGAAIGTVLARTDQRKAVQVATARHDVRGVLVDAAAEAFKDGDGTGDYFRDSRLAAARGRRAIDHPGNGLAASIGREAIGPSHSRRRATTRNRVAQDGAANFGLAAVGVIRDADYGLTAHSRRRVDEILVIGAVLGDEAGRDNLDHLHPGARGRVDDDVPNRCCSRKHGQRRDGSARQGRKGLGQRFQRQGRART